MCVCVCVCTECPDGFTNVAGADGCYKMLTYKMTWSAAALMCRAYNKNAHLTVIDSAVKQNAVAAWASADSGKTLASGIWNTEVEVCGNRFFIPIPSHFNDFIPTPIPFPFPSRRRIKLYRI